MRGAVFYPIAICLVVYLFSAKGYIEVTDTTYSVETARALVTRGELAIPASADWTLAGPSGRHYSKYGIGLPLYYVPFVSLAETVATITGVSRERTTGFLISFANVPFAGLALWAFMRLLRHFRPSDLTTTLLILTLGLATLTWKYAAYDFSEVMQMALLLTAILGVVSGGRRWWLAAGGAFGWLVLVKLVFLALLPGFVLYLLWRLPRPERWSGLGWFLIGPLSASAFLAWLNTARFGSMWESGYGPEAGRFAWSQLPHTIPSLLFSLDKGLFVFSPILLAGLLGWPAMRRHYPRECALFVYLLAANLIIAGSWHSWMGGASWGPRLLVPLIPLWLLPAVFALRDWPARRQWLAFVLVVVPCIGLQVAGVLVKDQEIHHIRELMLTYAERRVSASDFESAWILLRHKMSHDEVYRASEFHVPSERQLDLTTYRTFLGINVWTEHLARELDWPWVRWLPLLGLIAVAWLMWRMIQALKRPLHWPHLG